MIFGQISPCELWAKYRDLTAHCSWLITPELTAVTGTTPFRLITGAARPARRFYEHFNKTFNQSVKSPTN